MFKRKTKIIFQLVLISLIPMVSFQNCSGDVDFKKRKTPVGPLYGNGSGHEGKPTIPIDYINEIAESKHYQESINFSQNPSSSEGHLEDVVYYCRSIGSEATNGVDLVITKAVQELRTSEEQEDFSRLPAGATFTRSSPATAWSSDGRLQVFSANQARLQVLDSRSAEGFLMEAAATNEILNSENLLATSWSTTRANVVSTAGNDSPTLASQAFVLSEGTFPNFHYLEQAVNLSPSTNYSFSVYGKEVSPGRGFSVRLYDIDGSSVRCSYSFSDQSISRSSSSKTFDCHATEHSRGWVRLSVSATTENGAAAVMSRVKIELFNPALGGGYTGTNHPGVILWGAQLEASQGLTTSYIPTGSSPATRSADSLVLRNGFNKNSDAKLTLQYKLAQANSNIDLQFPQLTSSSTPRSNLSQTQVSFDAGQGVISKSFASARYDNKLSLKLLNDQYSLFSGGEFVGHSLAARTQLGSIVLTPQVGSILIDSFSFSYSSPINEVLSLTSQATPIAGLQHAVLVLGRHSSTGNQRIQTQAVPLESDIENTAWTGFSNNISIWPEPGRPGVFRLSGMLSDNSSLDSLTECRRPE